ncbi:MAG: DUF177 domain-containing protein [Firmicutes bacterium]|nr:DUF177 domain-containing protein [Bacillota bacterium]
MKPIYLVDLTSIKDSAGARMDLRDQVTLPNFTWEGERLLEFDNPWWIELEITNVSRGYQVHGKTGGRYWLDCDRCLERVRLALETEFDDLFLPESISSQEEEARSFAGDELDLSATIMEAVVLQIPLKVLCASTCRGLCSVCGTNLNKAACNCKTESFDPRLATLLKWKQDKGGGDDGQS